MGAAVKGECMKLAGLGLLLAGWGIVLSSLVLLHTPASRSAFVPAGVIVELLGLALLLRSHMVPEERTE